MIARRPDRDLALGFIRTVLVSGSHIAPNGIQGQLIGSAQWSNQAHSVILHDTYPYPAAQSLSRPSQVEWSTRPWCPCPEAREGHGEQDDAKGRDGRDQDRAANQDCNQPQQEQAARWGRVRQSAHCPLCPAEEAGQPHMPVAQGGRPQNLDACPLAAVQASPRLPPAECCCCCPRWSQLDTWTRGRPDLLDSQLRDHSSSSSPSRLLPLRTLFCFFPSLCGTILQRPSLIQHWALARHHFVSRTTTPRPRFSIPALLPASRTPPWRDHHPPRQHPSMTTCHWTTAAAAISTLSGPCLVLHPWPRGEAPCRPVISVQGVP